jgi:hypothetical protein
MVDRGLISEFERSLSCQEGPVWFPVWASLCASKLGYEIVVAQRVAKTSNYKLAAAFDRLPFRGKAPALLHPVFHDFHFSFFYKLYREVLILRMRE